ncbi:MAG: DOMON domain-containing protein [Candidatus Kariarchaeaceae archaeon]
MSPTQIYNTTADHVKVPFAYLYHWDLGNTIQDGIINENEYPDSVIMDDLGGNFVSEVSWGHDNVTIAIGITINGTGWIGLGMGEVGIGMAGADIIMASYESDSNRTTIQDMHSIDQNDPIVDVDQYQFPSIGGNEVDGETTIEFTVPMSSLDEAGYDHFWHVGSWFGFFTAFRKSGIEFDKKHNAHSPSKDVKILDASFPPPEEIEHTFTVSIDQSTDELVLASSLIGGIPIENHEVGFFQKTLFGILKIEDVFTDDQGYAETRISSKELGKVEFTAVFFGDENHKRNERLQEIDLGLVLDDEIEEFGDFRDIVGRRFMRTAMLFGFFFVITMLFYVYATSILSLAKISKLGKEFDKKNQTNGGSKQ